MKLTQLNLPEFGFADGCGEDSPLRGRNVILCIRSASVVEMFMRDNVIANDSQLSFKFTYTRPDGTVDKMICMLHHSPLLDVDKDAAYIKENIMKPAIIWYGGWLDYKYKAKSNGK